jgi:hypothetical protein
MSQGAEIEITPIRIGYLDPTGAGRVRTCTEDDRKWDVRYNTKLFTTLAVTNVPELYITTDHMNSHAIFEVVTGPVMTRKVSGSPAHEQLTCELMGLIHYLHKTVRDATRPWLLVRDVIQGFNRTIGRATGCRPLIPTRACLATEIAIDVPASQAAMKLHNQEFIVQLCPLVNEPWAKLGKKASNKHHILFDGMTVYTQHTGSIPIDRLYLEESRDRLIQLIWGSQRIDLLKRAFQAGNAVVDQFFVPWSHKEQKADRKILRKLRGLMILTFYILHMGLVTSDRFEHFGGSLKNRYDLLPRHALRDVTRAALSHNARTLLFAVMTDPKRKLELYSVISYCLGLAVGTGGEHYNLDAKLAFEDHQPTVRQFLDDAFAPGPTEQTAYQTTQVARTDPALAQKSAVAVPYPLSRNVDDRKEKKPENSAVVRNLLFESRSCVTGTSHSAFCFLTEIQRAKLTELWDHFSG